MTAPATFSQAYRIIQMAYRKAQIIQTGDEPTGEQLAEGMNELNDLINVLQTNGTKLWQETDYAITLVSQQGGPYLLGPSSPTRALRVPYAYYADQYGNKRPLIQLSRQEWVQYTQNIPGLVTSFGPPNSYWLDVQPTLINFWLWPFPDATSALGTAHAVYQQQITNVVGMTDTLNFPQEWFIALYWNLASLLAIGQPEPIRAVCERNADRFLTAVMAWDEETSSLYFAPDYRGGYNVGNFQ